MSERDKNYWFKRRRYGYGWTPSTWQGWTSLVVYLALMIGTSLLILGEGETIGQILGFLAVASILTGCLILLTLIKGPSPKWRWGVTDDDNPTEDV